MNQLKTLLLLGGLTALLLWVGQFFGGITGLTIALVIVGVMNIGMYWFSDKIVLSMYRGKQVEKSSNLYHMVKEVSDKAGVPMPKVYIIPSKNPNAFATGRSPKHSAVAVTQGLMELLSHQEIKAVLAHEIAHIKNRDTLITTVASVLAGVIAYAAMMMRWAAIFGGFGRNDRDGSNIFELLALAIVTPIIATIIQFAISRQREYLADERGSKIINNPEALADALIKIESGVKHYPMTMGNAATASMFIANPFRTNNIMNLFSTHPPVADRVAKLRKGGKR